MMLRGLLEKELRQHALTFSILLLLLLAGLGAIVGNHRLARQSGSELQAYVLLLWTLIPLASLTLGQVLVASEFRQRTQLFLEGLPFPRWRFIAVKYLLGLAFTLLLGGAALAVVLWRSWDQEALTPKFAAIVAMKSGAWIALLHALFFAHAFLGRYRWAAAGLIMVALINVAAFELSVHELPPLQLVDVRFAYDRYALPWSDVLWTLALTGVFAAGGFALGLVRDATVASLLAERMSAREKSVATVVLIATTLGSVIAFEKKEQFSPVHLPGVLTERARAQVTVAAAVDPPTKPEAHTMKAISPRVADWLHDCAEYLDIERFPPVFVVHRRDLSGAAFEDGGLKRPQGLLVRANLLGPEFNEAALQRWLLKHLLLLQSEQRLALERNAWLLDGFPRWWQSRTAAVNVAETTSAELPKTVQGADLSAQSLRRWFSIRKTAGAEAAEHLAASGLRTLEQMAGEVPMREFLRTSVGRSRTKDARTWFREMLTPWPREMQRTTGATPELFVQNWKHSIAVKAQ